MVATSAWMVLLPMAYLMAVGRFGWSHADDGFVLGYVWRLLNGEVPYRDFIYVRPPGSIYLHALWTWMVPTNWVYFTGRAVFCFELMTASMVASWALGRSKEAPDFLKTHWRTFGGFAFVVSAATLNAFPWHTVDGIFLSALGGALILTSPLSSSVTWLKCLFGGCLFVMAALCKQSFYPWPVLVLMLLAWDRAGKKALWVTVGLAIASGAAYAYMSSNEMWEAFRLQTTGNLALSDAFVAGVYPYVKSLFVIGLPALLLAVAGRAIAAKVGSPWHTGMDAIALAVTTFGACILLYSMYGSPNMVFINLWFDQTVWCMAAVWCLMAVLKREKSIDLLAWLGLAWCASISWGMMTPALFSIPSVVGAWLFLFGNQSKVVADKPATRWARVALGIAAGSWLLLALTRGATLEDWPSRLTCSLSTASPFYSGVRTSEKNCEKVAEMTAIVQALNSRSVVFLPAFTAAYMQFGLKNPLPIDLPTLTEMSSSSDRVMAAFKSKTQYVLVEKEADYIFQQTDEKGRFYVPLVRYAQEQFKKMPQTKHFDVYKNPGFKP